MSATSAATIAARGTSSGHELHVEALAGAMRFEDFVVPKPEGGGPIVALRELRVAAALFADGGGHWSPEADPEGAAELLEAAVGLGHLETSHALLRRGERLARPLRRQDLEATVPLEGEEDEATFWRRPVGEHTEPNDPLVWWLGPWKWQDRHPSVVGRERWVCDAAGRRWKQWPDVDGTCFFGRSFQGRWCEWAADWDRPVSEARARVDTPWTRLALALAAAGKLGMLELEQEAAARLLDAAVLFGKPEAAASLAAHCAEVPRTLRVWLREDLVSFDGSWPLGELSLKCPNVVAAHGF